MIKQLRTDTKQVIRVPVMRFWLNQWTRVYFVLTTEYWFVLSLWELLTCYITYQSYKIKFHHSCWIIKTASISKSTLQMSKLSHVKPSWLWTLLWILSTLGKERTIKFLHYLVSGCVRNSLARSTTKSSSGSSMLVRRRSFTPIIKLINTSFWLCLFIDWLTLTEGSTANFANQIWINSSWNCLLR